MTVDYSVQRVENPDNKLIDDSVALFLELMSNDTSMRVMVGDDISLLPDLARPIFRAIALAGEYYTATLNETGKVIGIAVWMPAGQDLFSTEEQKQLGLYDFMAKLSPEAKSYYIDIYLKEFPALVAKSLGSPNARRDSWWLHMALVTKEHQHKGIATALIDLVKEKAGKAGETVAMSVTDEKNIPVYTSMGFDIRGRTRMKSPWGDFPLVIFSRT